MSPLLPGSIPKKKGLLVKIFLSPLGFFYRLWTLSIRMRYSPADGLEELTRHPSSIVLTLWHNRLFLAGEWHNRYRKEKTIYGLISASKDGAWLETFYGWTGIRAVRGSQNRRGVQAMRELVKVIKVDGNDVGITPDGSRGPKYQAKQGAMAVAKITKAPVLLLSFEYSRAMRLNSWDGFVIPYPFSSVKVTTKLLSSEFLCKSRSTEEAAQIVEDELNQITKD
jgi:lysophospholipid acyltransferase (LPLAT)-like uncharacterized protein